MAFADRMHDVPERRTWWERAPGSFRPIAQPLARQKESVEQLLPALPMQATAGDVIEVSVRGQMACLKVGEPWEELPIIDIRDGFTLRMGLGGNPQQPKDPMGLWIATGAL